MTEPPRVEPPAPVSGAQTYGFACLLCLGAIIIGDMQRGPGLTTVLKVAIGLLGVVARMRAAPVLLLVVVAIEPLLTQLHFVGMMRGWRFQGQPLGVADVVQAAGLLGYILAQCRLQALTLNVFPVDPRRRRITLPRYPGRPAPPPPPPDAAPPTRSQELVGGTEVGLLMLVVPAAVLAGVTGWLVLSRPWNVAGLPPQFGRMMLVLWWLALGIPVVVGLLGHWRTRKMARAEAELHLQDVLWQQTRREQRRQNQWIAWSSLPRDGSEK